MVAGSWHAHQASPSRWVQSQGWATRVLLLCIGATLASSAATLANRTMYQQPAWSKKTLTGCLPAALANALNLLIFHVRQRRRRRHPGRAMSSGSPLLAPVAAAGPAAVAEAAAAAAAAAKPPAPRQRCCRRWHLLIPPALLDLATTVALNVAIERTAASVVSMLCSSGIVVVALFSKCLLKTTYTYSQWAGILMATVGLALVSAASVIHSRLDLEGLSASDLVGALSAIGSQLTVGLAWCLEERYLKRRYFAPVEQVGIEGCIQLLVLFVLVFPFATLAVLPGRDHRHLEDVLQAARLIFSGTPEGILLLLLGLVELVSVLSRPASWLIALTFYNPLSQAIGAASGSVLRVCVTAVRALLVWGGGLLIFHATAGRYGEEWFSRATWRAGFLQVAGFCCLLAGIGLFARGHRGVHEPLAEAQSPNGDEYALTPPSDADFGSSLFGPDREDSRDSVSQLLDELAVGTPAASAAPFGSPPGSSGTSASGASSSGQAPHASPLYAPPHHAARCVVPCSSGGT